MVVHGCVFSYGDITLILFRYDRRQKCLGGQKRHDLPRSHCPPDLAPQYEVHVPLILMTSFNTHEDTLRIIKKYANESRPSTNRDTHVS